MGVFVLVVLSERLRQGIGRFLMDHVERLARERGLPFVRWGAYAVNPFSTALYQAIEYDERATITLRGTGLVLFERRVL